MGVYDCIDSCDAHHETKRCYGDQQHHSLVLRASAVGGQRDRFGGGFPRVHTRSVHLACQTKCKQFTMDCRQARERRMISTALINILLT